MPIKCQPIQQKQEIQIIIFNYCLIFVCSPKYIFNQLRINLQYLNIISQQLFAYFYISLQPIHNLMQNQPINTDIIQNSDLKEQKNEKGIESEKKEQNKQKQHEQILDNKQGSKKQQKDSKRVDKQQQGKTTTNQNNKIINNQSEKIEEQNINENMNKVRKNQNPIIEEKQSRKEKTKVNQQKNQVLENIKLELLDMGFQIYLVQQALKITNDKDKAIQYIITTLENQEQITQKKKYKPKYDTKQQKYMNMNEKKVKNQKMQEQQDFQDVEEQYKMVFLVRMDLKMGLGKIAAQVAHATLKAYKQMVAKSNYNDFDFVALEEWKQLGQKKIVVKVNDQNQLLQTVDKAQQKGINSCYIRDAGLTQIASGSITVAAIGPAPSSQIDDLTKKFKLL